MFDIQNKLNKYNLHYIFLGILSLNYLIPLLIFKDITLFYHDALDSEIVYNSVIGKAHLNGLDEIKIFLNEQIKIDYLRRAFQPLTLLYSIFNIELAYWLTDIIVKLTSYFSFYLLAKKFHKKSFPCYLSACLYASINIPTHSGLGTAIFPYIIYLLIYKENINLKNYIIIFFFGLNSDFLTTILSLPFLFLLTISITPSNKKFKFAKYVKIFLAFCAAIVISNNNLILLTLGSEVMHREEFIRESQPFINILKIFFIDLFKVPSGFNWYFFYSLPMMLLTLFVFLFIFSIKNKQAKYIFFLIIFLHLIMVGVKLNFIAEFYSNLPGLLRTLNPVNAQTILPLLFTFLTFLMLINAKFYLRKIFNTVIISCVLLTQVNSSIVPSYKKFIIKEDNYRNIYTFKGYYLYEGYIKVKQIVKNKKTISIGLDPMSAIVNGIYTIDGYHNLYPLAYKKKFYKIIEDELSNNLKTKKYFKNWGSRVYAFVNDPENIKINFKEAKKVGADYVISKYDLNNDKLSLICRDCSKYFNLYIIN
jgi:hypothetical protein